MKMRMAADQTLGHGRSMDSLREPESRSPVRKSVSRAGRQPFSPVAWGRP